MGLEWLLEPLNLDIPKENIYIRKSKLDSFFFKQCSDLYWSSDKQNLAEYFLRGYIKQ